MFGKLSAIILALLVAGFATSAEQSSTRANVLFIAIDDLNDWIGCMGGHPQSITPNLDRLAASGVLFTNAHCPGAACNPSRTAIMTGIAPHRSGLYGNRQKMRKILPDAPILPQHFRSHGYRAIGSGKMLHYFIDAPSWDEYFPKAESENPFPRTLYPEERPVSLPVGGPWQYVETDWAALEATDEEFGGDWLVSQWVGEQLRKEQDQPFFLACGIYRPHEPWFVPARYFEPFPLEDIELPPGYREDDLDDLPPEGKRRGPNRYFAHIREHKQWKPAIQGYLASIHFADAMLGRVLDALEEGPHRDNTIVVLWSDHGWHLGEKQHWQKFTAWRAVTRVPLIIRVPTGPVPGLPEGTSTGTVCDAPVDLLSLFPTLTELTGIPSLSSNDGPSLLPLLRNPDTEWSHIAITHLSEPGSYGLSAKDWRYIRYAGGDEELYHIASDPYEWDNLLAEQKPQRSAGISENAIHEKLQEMRALGPTSFAPKEETAFRNAITTQSRSDTLTSVSKLDEASSGDSSKQLTDQNQDSPKTKISPRPRAIFKNESDTEVTLFWLPPGRKDIVPTGNISPGSSRAVETTLGHRFRIEGEGIKRTVTIRRPSETILITSPAPALAKANVSDDAPNIVVIMADDWSSPHASILGDSTVRTPNFDRIAREGVLFDYAFTPVSSCTPARHVTATGQAPWRLGQGINLGSSLQKNIPVYPDLLSAAGYLTGYSRKGTEPSRHDHRGNDPFGKHFDRFSTFLQERNEEQPFAFFYGAGEPHRPFAWQDSLASDLDLESIKVPLFLPDNATTRTDLGDYYLKVEKLDRFAGEILTTLEEAGELESTIVVMTSDNGMAFPRAKATLYDSGCRIPLAIRWGEKVNGGRRLPDFVTLADLAPTFLEASGLSLPETMTGQSLLPILLSEEDESSFEERDHVILGMEQHVYPNPSRAIRTKDLLYIRNFAPEVWPTGENDEEPVQFDFKKTPWPTVQGAFSHNIDPGPCKQWMRFHHSPVHALAFGKRPAEELYDLRSDPDQVTNLLAGPATPESITEIRRELSELLTEELRTQGDPRFAEPGHATFAMHGWKLHLSDRLWAEEAEATRQMLELLDGQLERVALAIPEPALGQIRRIPIWINPPYLGRRGTAEYHPSRGWLEENGRNPKMAQAVEISNVLQFPFENRRMPYLLLHELAHGYHDRILEKGYGNETIRGAFQLAEESGIYERVERFDGNRFRRDRAYAISNPMEYFAEATEAYFGRNDFYPFNREELKKHDPVIFGLLPQLWQLKSDSAP